MPDVRPLSARSVILSLMLGAHPRGMAAHELTRAGEYFDVSPATVRVALTRAVASDELRREDSTYFLGSRLLARYERQEQHAAEVAWDGSWEMAVVTATSRPGGERASLRDALARQRLAELREGVWMRPANLGRAPAYADAAVLRTFRATPHEDPASLAASLWDLPGWAAETHARLALLETTTEPAARLAVAAHLVRHLADDPLLPTELWPSGWPSQHAREVYAAYQRELHTLSTREFTA
ncbi:unannotated protein [freshwater metagenome]|uniref:Unannotated protein n=1 Tax=freshwater metagenome TaxID=449393 RepID=A0A6J6R7R6_9ZZZZ